MSNPPPVNNDIQATRDLNTLRQRPAFITDHIWKLCNGMADEMTRETIKAIHSQQPHDMYAPIVAQLIIANLFEALSQMEPKTDQLYHAEFLKGWKHGN